MYKLAYKYNDEIIFYFDHAGNKYVASGGNLPWRINNPGLVSSHSHFSRNKGAIGCCGRYAIFSNALEGHKALLAWLHSKKYYNSSLEILAEHYQPKDSEAFTLQLAALTQISPDRKIKSLNKTEFDRLIKGLEKLCGYKSIGDESFVLLPKITAKIDNGDGREATYLIEGNTILSKDEAIKQILSHRLDAVIVHEQKDNLHLRSRPNNCFWTVKIKEVDFPSLEGQIDTLVRTVGEKKAGQCVWGFINGISNTREEALASANGITKLAGGERVFSMPNDTILKGFYDFGICCILKTSLDTPIVRWAVIFLRYLLSVSKQEGGSPVILFVHSQGAIIAEHAIELLNQSERKDLRIFTFGGGSFLSPGKTHEDTHNYASAADLVCRAGSLNHQYLALQRYYGHKEGLTEQQVIEQLVTLDEMLYLESTNLQVVQAYAKERRSHYESEFSKISNVTVLDPDPDSRWKHRFSSDCYQAEVEAKIKKYKELQKSKSLKLGYG